MILARARNRLASRFALIASLLSVGLIALLAGGLYAVSRNHLPDEYRRAVAVAANVGGVVSNIEGAMRSAAGSSSLLANALVDSVFLAAGVGAALLVVAGSSLAGCYVTRSLRQLEGLATTVMHRGLVADRAPVAGTDEVARLATAFNYMLDTLTAMTEERERQSTAEIARQRHLAERAERARSEAELARAEADAARRQAEMAGRATSRFLAAASHDLRQPLQAVVCFSSLLRHRLAGSPNQVLLDELDRSLTGLCGLLDAILDLSRIDAGVKVCQTEFPVAQVLTQLEAEFRPQAREMGLTLRVVGCGVWVNSDPAIVTRIVRNLLANAVRYTDRGRVLLGCRRVGGAVRIEVWDTGPGIPDDQTEAVFEEFYQLGNPERNRDHGLGLGLAIVRRLASLLGHRVALKSRVGRGTVFSLEIPARASTSG